LKITPTRVSKDTDVFFLSLVSILPLLRKKRLVKKHSLI
jgi:hypothetical protein